MNSWQKHVKETQLKHPKLKFGEVLKLAAKSYKR